ncbi:MAG: hypothetical protein ACHQ1D_00895 [Nitrososphaerales archaeon]
MKELNINIKISDEVIHTTIQKKGFSKNLTASTIEVTQILQNLISTMNKDKRRKNK